MQSRKLGRAVRRVIESLESRLYMHGLNDTGFFTATSDTIIQPGVAAAITADAQAAGESVAAAAPVLASLPGATDTLYLDFDGHFEALWGSYSNVTTPEFNLDGVAGFNAAELTAIQNIWSQVAEDYAPFNINVTTVQPTSFANGVSLRVAIGGNSNWLGQAAGGVAYVDSYTNSIVNTVYVFPDHLSKVSKYIAEAASHESGHGFGLQHQSSWNGGSKTEYYAGPGDGRAPIMGNSYSATRGLWWNGTTLSATTIQDDMAVIAKAANTFGYRTDDYADAAGAAFTLTPTGSNLNATGIVSRTSDRDYFRFDTGAGSVTLNVTVPTNNNLDAKLELWSADGLTMIASNDPSGFGASITATLAGGSYLLVVASHGGYGDVGQYTVGGTVVQNLSTIATPTNFTATATGTNVALSWIDNATNETGYVLERATNVSFTGSTVFNLAADQTSLNNTGLAADTTYYFRVQAVNATSASAFANGSAITLPAVVTASAAAVSNSQINVSWTNPNAETSFIVERSTDQSAWTTIATPAANVLSVSDTGRSALTTYYYRVSSVNAAGTSVSGIVSATTLATPVTPAAPTGLTYTSLTRNSVALRWTDVATNESNYVVQRSTNGGGGSWSTVATVAANSTAYNVTGLSKRRTYSFRVYATNAAGPSGYSNTLTVTTPNNSQAVAGPTLGSTVEQLKKKQQAALA